jgi:hypothetical protein
MRIPLEPAQVSYRTHQFGRVRAKCFASRPLNPLDPVWTCYHPEFRVQIRLLRCILHSAPRSMQRECRSPVSRILSLPLARDWTAISLTPPERSALLAQDATNTRESTGGQPFPCSVLHHARFAVPSGYPDSRWALTPPFHPCLCPRGPSAVSFCCTVCPGSSRCPSLTFMRRVALWCPDFPQLRLHGTATVRGAARQGWGSLG